MFLDSGLTLMINYSIITLIMPGKHMVYFCEGAMVHFIYAEYLAQEFL